MTLAAEQTTALENLRRKAAGQDVGWINISAARALTAAGLAQRDRQGWRITAAGEAELQTGSTAGASDGGGSSLVRMMRPS